MKTEWLFWKNLRQFSLDLTDANNRANLYRISGSKFVYIGWSQEEMQVIVQQIEDRVKKGFELQDMVVQLNVKYYFLCYPKHGKTPKELEKAIQYCMENRNQNNDAQIVYADEKMLEEFKWRDEITETAALHSDSYLTEKLKRITDAG